MMTSEDIRQASGLIEFGLHTKLKPADSREYATLYARYRNEPDFAIGVRAIAAGQKQTVLETDSDEAGLVLVPSSADSLYAHSLGDLRALPPDKRQVFALTLCAVTKIFFPTEQSLYTTDSARVAVSFTALLTEIERLALLYGGPDSASPEVVDVLDGWALMAGLSIKADKEKGANTRTLTGYLRLALKNLTEEGLVRVHGSEKGSDTAGSYIATHRFQLQVRDVVLPAWFDILCQVQRATPTVVKAVIPAKQVPVLAAAPESPISSIVEIPDVASDEIPVAAQLPFALV
jgi:hypothetical protein